MITIQENTAADLDALAAELYENLNPKLNDNVTYAERSLIRRIERERDEAANNNHLYRVNFWNYLLQNNHQKLYDIITSRPDVLKNVINEINTSFGPIMFSNQKSYNDADLTPFGKVVADTFDYSLYRDKDYCADNFEQFNLHCCPYCNMTHVYVDRISELPDGEKRGTKFHQLDHFFPQSRYPYLSLSFFNLIPSCSYCNSQCKREKDFQLDTHFNPFHKSFNQYFRFTLLNAVVQSPSDMQFDILNFLPHANNSVTDFQLVGRYNIHSVQRETFRGYKAIQVRSQRTRNSIANTFKKLFGSDDRTLSSLLEAHNIPLQDNHINSTPIGKLKRDLFKELGVIN